MRTRFTLPLTRIAASAAFATLLILQDAFGAAPTPDVAPSLVAASLHTQAPAAQTLDPALARARLETLGFSLDPDTFVKVVAGQYAPLSELFLCAGVGLDGRDAQGRSALFVAVASRQWALADVLFGLHAGNASSPYAAHGCIRLPAAAARRLFQEVPEGTVVQIGP